MMKPIRQIVPVLVMTALFPLHAGAADLKWNGFLDLTFMAVDDTVEANPSETESKFGIAGELDLSVALGNKVTTRFDLDLGSSKASEVDIADIECNVDLVLEIADCTIPTSQNEDSGRFEQAFVEWESSQGINLKGGLFNNPLSWEAEDAPNMYQISHGQLYTIWDLTTALNGNNLLGIAVSGKTGAVTLTGAILNDLFEVPEKNSFMAMALFKPNAQMDLKVGIITQDTALETILDVNMTYTQGLVMLGGEIMLPSEFIDMGLGVTGTYKFSEQVMGTLRFDNVSYDGDGDDSRSLTVAVGYLLEKNLAVNAELRSNTSDDEDVDGSQVQLELVATF